MEGDQVGGLIALGLLGFLGVLFLIILAINILVCFLLYKDYKAIPAQFRKLEPGLVWLLLIPCFGLVWNFFVFPRLGESFKAYFDSVGQTDVGDGGTTLGWAYAICAACTIIPYANVVAGVAAIVLLILFLVKAGGLKNRIPEAP